MMMMTIAPAVSAIAAMALAAEPAGAADPQPARAIRNLSGWFTVDDYPTEALRRNGQGVVRFRLTIDPQGAVSNCAVTASSGDPDLDRVTCEVLRTRAHYQPALDAGGRAVEGTDDGSVAWRLPDQSDTRPPLEATRFVSSMRLDASGGVACTFTVNGDPVRTRPGDECGFLKNSGWDRGLRGLRPGAEVTLIFAIRPGDAAPSVEDAGVGELLMESRARATIASDGRVTECRPTLSRIVAPYPGLSRPLDACAQRQFQPGPPSVAFRFADIEYRLYLKRGAAR